jgi:[ribosomal protein S18]-alanine N-acetyltransferase
VILSLFRKTPAPMLANAMPRDAAELAAIHASGFERGWDTTEIERLLAQSQTVGHLARPGGKRPATGFVLSRMAPPEAEIITIAVLPKARGAGLAKTLLRHHLGRLAALGVRSVFLEVAEDNRAALRLYEAFGFAQVGHRQGYYARAGGTAATAIVMRRDIG